MTELEAALRKIHVLELRVALLEEGMQRVDQYLNTPLQVDPLNWKTMPETTTLSFEDDYHNLQTVVPEEFTPYYSLIHAEWAENEKRKELTKLVMPKEEEDDELCRPW